MADRLSRSPFMLASKRDSAPPPPPPAVDSKQLSLAQYQPLRALLTAEDQRLVTVLSETTDMAEFDKLAKSLFLLFEWESKVQLLVHAAIEREIASCAMSSLLFRNNSMCSKVMTVFARMQALDYLRVVLGPHVDAIAASTGSYEVDPTRAQASTDLAGNMAQLLALTTQFMDSILGSLDHVSIEMKRMCAVMQKHAVAKFPDARHTVVAGFFFLRYVCPAIVTPTAYGLLSTMPKKEAHRGLVLVAKTLQNLANGVHFGQKEDHMIPLNAFIESYETKLKNFLDALAVEGATGPAVTPLGQTEAQAVQSYAELYTHLSKNMSRIQTSLEKNKASAQLMPALNQVKVFFADLEKQAKAAQASAPAAAKRNKDAGGTMGGLATVLGDLPRLTLFSHEIEPQVLNGATVWNDLVRPPALIALDLLLRVRALLLSFANKSESGNRIGIGAQTITIDWQELANSVDFDEFAVDTCELQEVDLRLLEGNKEALSFWLNIYNVMVVHNLIKNGPPKSRQDVRTLSSHFCYRIGGARFTLDDVMEGVLRGNPDDHFRRTDLRLDYIMKQYDPRAHFCCSWLNEGSASMRVFKPDTISTQLVLASEEYLQSQVSAVVDKKKIRLPVLLKDYVKDFGKSYNDLFRFLARYLDQQTSTEISTIVCTTHYTIEWVEPSFEPRRRRLFVDDPLLITRTSPVEEYLRQFPVQATMSQLHAYSAELDAERADEIGVLNMERRWTAMPRAPFVVLKLLMDMAQGMCHSFLFDWGTIAGSVEFQMFLLATGELQWTKVDSLPKDQRLPFWVNLHNILMIHLYIMHRPPAEMTTFNRKSIFSTYKYNVGGLTYSINDISLGILRDNQDGQFKKKDPRMDMVLSADGRILCMLSQLTKSTPVVRWYEPEGFEISLTKATQTFVRTHLACDMKTGKVVMPYHLRTVYEIDFNKRKEDFLTWSLPFLTADQKLVIETLLTTRRVSLSFAEVDWTPWPVFDMPM